MISNLPLSMWIRIPAFLVILSLSSMAQANGHGQTHGGSNGGAGRPQGFGAPEIDPTMAGAGIVVLVAGTLALLGRRRPAKA